MSQAVDKLEIIYFEIAKMEQSISNKAKIVLETEEKISKQLTKFEILQKELINKLENNI